MKKIKFYSFINNFGNISFIIDSCLNNRIYEKVGFMLFNRDGIWTLGYFNGYTPIQQSDTLIEGSIIDFIKILKQNNVTDDIINQAIKQCEEWSL